MVDLSKYAVFANVSEDESIHDTMEFSDAIEKFNNSMAGVIREYSAKEKWSCMSARNIVLTD